MIGEKKPNKKKQAAQMTFTVGFGVPVLLHPRFSPNRSQIAQLYVTSYIKSALKEGENATHRPQRPPRHRPQHPLPSPRRAGSSPPCHPPKGSISPSAVA